MEQSTTPKVRRARPKAIAVDGRLARPGPVPVPTIVLPQLFAMGGEYPVAGPGSAQDVTAMVQTFAGAAAYGAPRARGQILQVISNQPLMALIGPAYGGDGIETIALPNLAGRAAILAELGLMGKQTLGMSWLIAVQAAPGGPPLGSLALFASDIVPPGWLVADGSTLPVQEYPDLFGLIGNAFGGEEVVFNLPNLTGRTPIGVGEPLGLPAVSLGQAVAAPQPALGLTFIICATGAAPPPAGNGAFPVTSFAGQVVAYGAAQPPAGWLFADGSLTSISANPGLFQAIGTAYGGDGKTSFAVPDLRGRVVLGA
ncbi:MAG TPA: phage tail protein [Allosphingosinicella sp.]|nr:phage tail protein [Allosphingosinicella sp.]